MKKAELYVAHPGHELALATWANSYKPVINILTDGSGSLDKPRLASSNWLVDELRCSRGHLFGAYRDQTIYEMILSQNIEFFRDLVEAIVDKWGSEPPELVVVDELDGHNSAHDLLNLLVANACIRFERTHGQTIPLYCYYLIQHENPKEGAISVALREKEHEYKKRLFLTYEVKPKSIDIVMCRFGIDSYLHYPDSYLIHCRTLGVEPDNELMMQAQQENGEEIDIYRRIASRVKREQLKLQVRLGDSRYDPDTDRSGVELLNTIDPDRTRSLESYPTTFYELYGEEKVEKGVYSEILRQSHLENIWNAPLVD